MFTEEQHRPILKQYSVLPKGIFTFQAASSTSSFAVVLYANVVLTSGCAVASLARLAGGLYSAVED